MSNLDKTRDEINDILNQQESVPTGDDKGLKIVDGQISTGDAGENFEAVFGEGDSYPVGQHNSKVFHCKLSETTGETITNAIEKTTELSSDNSSTAGLFGGVTGDEYILAFSDHAFGGVKAKIVTKGVIDSDLINAQYMNVQGNWINTTFMASDSSGEKEQKNREIGLTCNDCSEHWSFGFNPLELPVQWDETTFVINGISYTGYFARIKLLGAGTTDITLEQLKLHTNRTEIDNMGVDFWGRARRPFPLLLEWHTTEELQGFSPANENIDFGVNFSIVYQNNRFNNNAIDGRGGIITIPPKTDTSIPVVFEVLWQPLNDTDGNVDFTLETIQKKIGEVLDNTQALQSWLPYETPTVDTDEDNVLKRTRFVVLIDRLEIGEILAFALKRDGSSDTYSGNIAVVNIRAYAHRWGV